MPFRTRGPGRGDRIGLRESIGRRRRARKPLARGSAMSLLDRLPEDVVVHVLAQLPPKSLAALLTVDRLHGTSDVFWRSLSVSHGVRLPPENAAISLRSKADARRTFIKGLRNRRERLDG